MHHRPLTRVPGTELLEQLRVVTARDRATTAEMLALISEADRRRLFARESFASMFRYCVRKLRMSEDIAYKRIQAARAARRFPAILDMVADGRLHLTAVVMLAPFLRREGATELLQAATHKTKFEIQRLLAERFPAADIPALVRPLVPEPVFLTVSQPSAAAETPQESPRTSEPAPVPQPAAPVAGALPPAPPARVAPLAPARFGVQFTFGEAALEKLRYAQALLGHAVPSGELPEVFERALDALIEQLERRKFAKGSRAAASSPKRAPGSRHIPAAVRREVWERDGGRCTFESATGERCDSCERLEFDHIVAAACGGLPTADNLRLRCRTHNQYAAEQQLGAEFMQRKRQQARERGAERSRRSGQIGATPVTPAPA
jgi:hypothetical protein